MLFIPEFGIGVGFIFGPSTFGVFCAMPNVVEPKVSLFKPLFVPLFKLGFCPFILSAPYLLYR